MALGGLPTPWLRPGMHVRVIAPSSPFPVADFERGVERLRTRFEVSYAPDVLDRAGYLAGGDARRLGELHAALDDPSVHALIAARGGYGATRLLRELPLPRIAERPKLLVGFSDVTALHVQWARAGLGSLHGPMVAALGRASEPLAERYLEALCGRGPEHVSDLTCITPGRARGVLLGGNLAVLTALLGTPFAPELQGAVLMLEDVGERPYRVDRMLTQWLDSGRLHGVAGIVLGAFTQAEPGADGVSVEHVLHERLGTLGVPVLSGLPSGHLDDNLELPFGSVVELDAASGALWLRRHE